MRHHTSTACATPAVWLRARSPKTCPLRSRSVVGHATGGPQGLCPVNFSSHFGLIMTLSLGFGLLAHANPSKKLSSNLANSVGITASDLGHFLGDLKQLLLCQPLRHQVQWTQS